MLPKEKKQIRIKAVYDTDLEPFLEKLGLLEDLKNGKLKCSVCACELSLTNFGGVYKQNGQLKLFCQKSECYLEVLKTKGC
ncbi:MAG: hypothetical protein ABIK61_04300 [candidate division WOR-3 bacterium]